MRPPIYRPSLILISSLWANAAFAQQGYLPPTLEALGRAGSPNSYSQELKPQDEPEANGEIEDIIIDASKSCEDELQAQTEGFNCSQVPPYDLNLKDNKGKLWRIRFFFGFSRTQYKETDLHIKSSVMNTTIRDVDIVERTSANHYNPANWGPKTFLKWIDEPTNTFIFSLEKGANSFTFTIFHPKYLKSVLYKKTVVDGEEAYEFASINESDDFSQTIPEGYSMFYLGNTHKNLDISVGYGRSFTLMNSQKWGNLSYTPHVGVGFTVGEARTVNIIPGVAWDDYIDKFRIQGFSYSAGHRLEYKRGRYSIFVDQTSYWWKRTHGAHGDGEMTYKLRAVPVTFGFGIDIFTNRRKLERQRAKQARP